jgi:hypothetical protein
LVETAAALFRIAEDFAFSAGILPDAEGLFIPKQMYDKALAEGVGPVTADSKMIDVPVVERARLSSPRSRHRRGRSSSPKSNT